MSKALDFFMRTVACRIPCAVALSVSKGMPVGGCLWPISSRAVIMVGTASWAFRKRLPVSASEAEAATVQMVLRGRLRRSADSENHVAGVITDGGNRMRGEVVEEHVASLFGMLRWGGFAVGNLVQGDNNSGVTAARIVEEEAGNLLDAFDTKFVKERR